MYEFNQRWTVFGNHSCVSTPFCVVVDAQSVCTNFTESASISVCTDSNGCPSVCQNVVVQPGFSKDENAAVNPHFPMCSWSCMWSSLFSIKRTFASKTDGTVSPVGLAFSYVQMPARLLRIRVCSHSLWRLLARMVRGGLPEQAEITKLYC